MTGIIDYGLGNLRSVMNALKVLGEDAVLIDDPDDLAKVDLIVLPGVGAFSDGMANLRQRGFLGPMNREVMERSKPFLGICLGMQLLATIGLEHGEHAGLGWVKGVVNRIPDREDLRVPHIGWNDVRFVRQDEATAGLGATATFYFVHSYKMVPEDQSVVVGECDYGVTFPAVIRHGNIMATQFHPEKSQKAGLALLKNFLRLKDHLRDRARVLKHRLIPVLLLQNGLLVRSELFTIHQVIGTPIHEVRRFNEWNVDELIYLDISREGGYDLRREDHKVRGLDDAGNILDAVSATCFMPLTWGGRIRTVEDMREKFRRGADKITVNSAAFREPALITQGAFAFGNQAIVLSIDALRHPDGRTEVFIDGGRTPTGTAPGAWARKAEEHGAGEILLQAIHRDGTGEGYDTELIREVAGAVRIPVIACSGVGTYEQYAEGIRAGAAAVAAANIWHFKELSDRGGKRALARAGINVRS